MDDHQSRPYLFLTQLDALPAGEGPDTGPPESDSHPIGARR